MLIPKEIKQNFLAMAHREIDFPCYLDELVLNVLEAHMASGCGWIGARGWTLNELADGVLI